MCGSGSLVDVPGERGTVTILFKNKDPLDINSYYLLTCAHVAGDVIRTPPFWPELDVDCLPNNTPFAETFLNTTINKNILAYDIAIAKLANNNTPQPELMVQDEGIRIEQFFPKDDIHNYMDVECRLGISYRRNGKIISGPSSWFLTYKNGSNWVDNLYEVDFIVHDGDSGSLVYKDSMAIGIITARTPDGNGLFHLLEDAFNYLLGLEPNLNIKIFN